MIECLTRDRGFEPHRGHCVVSLSKNINPRVLVQPRKTCSFKTERLLMGHKESNKPTNKQKLAVLSKQLKILYFIHDIISSHSLPSADSRRVVVSYKRNYVHKVLVYRLVKLAQEKSEVR